jgi:hypothetical protein
VLLGLFKDNGFVHFFCFFIRKEASVKECAKNYILPL